MKKENRKTKRKRDGPKDKEMRIVRVQTAW